MWRGATATNITTDWHERAAKWQFVALHGKPTSSALDKTKATRTVSHPASQPASQLSSQTDSKDIQTASQWDGNWRRERVRVRVWGSCRHLSHGHCMFEANLLQATARSRSCLGHQHLAPSSSAWLRSVGLLRVALYWVRICYVPGWARGGCAIAAADPRPTIDKHLGLGLLTVLSLLTILPLINSSSTWPKHLLHQLDGHRVAKSVSMCVLGCLCKSAMVGMWKEIVGFAVKVSQVGCSVKRA